MTVAADAQAEGTMLKAALRYAGRGWPVFPIYEMTREGCSCRRSKCTSPGKHPRTEGGHNEATVDEATIRAWWGDHPNANIGIRTGSESGLLVLDVDPIHGGNESFEEILLSNGQLEDGPESHTGSGGRHFLFKHPGFKTGNRANFRPGLDIRGDGGYIVAPPSNHKSGNHYEWDAIFDDATPPPEPPAWLLALVRESTSVEPLKYERIPYRGELPTSVSVILERNHLARSRYERSKKGLDDRSESGCDFSFAAHLAREGIPGGEIENAIRHSRDRAGLEEKRDGWYALTVGKVLANRQAQKQDEEISRAETRAVMRERLSIEAMTIEDWFLDDGSLVEPGAREYLLEGFLPAHVGVILAALGGSGKGHFEIALSVSLALGLPFGPFKCPAARPVIFVSREDDREEMQRRLHAAVAARFGGRLSREQRALLTRNLHIADLFGIRHARLGGPMTDMICEAARQIGGPGLIVLDPLGKCLPEDVDSINSQEGAARIHEEVDYLVANTGWTCSVAHHVSKGVAREGKAVAGASTGSLQLEDFARLVLFLTAMEEPEKRNLDPTHELGYVEVAMTKANYSARVDGLVLRREVGGALVPLNAKSQREVDARRALEILVEHDQTMSRDDWRSACKALDPEIPRDRADSARAWLRGRGLIMQVGRAGFCPTHNGRNAVSDDSFWRSEDDAA